MCRAGASHLSKLKPEFDKLGIHLVAIGLEKFGLDEFVAGKYWDGELYLDIGKKSYKSLDLQVNSLWNGYGLMNADFRKKHTIVKSQGFTGNLKGDGFQLGATLVMDPKEGCLFLHKQEFYGDHPEPEKVLEIASKGLTQVTKDQSEEEEASDD
eukprot:TRINITY_DN18220_c0_g1_i1.p1 TRINITY_DN18220_c0_g1~~TRINITY_DN18220_c0_g1_i1.p1  ORF type:complete len:154 (-),score=22.59 TRINITY_DN18220_c0_g1_i1:161-622(-)